MAMTGRPKLVNHISSLGVFAKAGAAGERQVNEGSSIEHERHLRAQGYAASKWVAERLFLQAMERGIACNILRLGLICPDTQQGRYDERQWNYRLIKSCLLCGYGIRSFKYGFPPTPVDAAARAIVHLATTHGQGRGIFHISSPTETLGAGLFESCNESGETALELLSGEEWSSQLRRSHERGRVLPMLPLIVHSSPERTASEEGHRSGDAETVLRVDCTRTRRELEAAGILMPRFNRELLEGFLRALISTDPDLRASPWREPQHREVWQSARGEGTILALGQAKGGER